MKLTFAALFALLGTLASGSSVKTVVHDAGASNALQVSDSDATIAKDGSHQAPWSMFGGGGNGNVEGAAEEGVEKPVDFFVKDFEKMDELPNYEAKNKMNQCHPKCKWSCGTSSCNTLCSPRCKAPKCVTACKKISLARCKRVCKDPQCAVVCPPQCEHGNCPKCKTVCGASVCDLNCGKGRCESTCADPDCVWDCKVNPACAKPQCKMTCDTSVCSFGKDQKLPGDHEVPYMGQEIAWKGLGKIPVKDLAEFAPKTFSKPGMLTGAKLIGGSQPMPKEGIKSLTGNTGISIVPTITGAGASPSPSR